jgi:hypothetical protein
MLKQLRNKGFCSDALGKKKTTMSAKILMNESSYNKNKKTINSK